MTIKLQVELVSNEAMHIIENTFDEMYKQSRLQYIIGLNSFIFPVFVIYKTNV